AIAAQCSPHNHTKISMIDRSRRDAFCRHQKFGVLVMIITDGEFLNSLTVSDNAKEEQVEARVESRWQDIATAPRDGQWFVALNRKSGSQYHVYWSAARDCFVNTKTNRRVSPTHWDGLRDD